MTVGPEMVADSESACYAWRDALYSTRTNTSDEQRSEIIALGDRQVVRTICKHMSQRYSCVESAMGIVRWIDWILSLNWSVL